MYSLTIKAQQFNRFKSFPCEITKEKSTKNKFCIEIKSKKRKLLNIKK